ncbi:MAG: hypothetical protein ACXVDD_00195 [Polyangia bacterium]
MKTRMWLALCSVSLLGLSTSACGTVETTPGGPGDMASGGGGGGGGGGGSGGDMAAVAGNFSIVGSWLSSGANLAPGFTKSPFNVKTITGVFNADFTYTVTSVDMSGSTTATKGTWVSMPSSVPGIFDFTQNQTSPSTATAKGIYQFDATGAALTLEGIQVSPSLGANPPTAQGGFGSTTVNGAKTSDWIQKYVRQ